MGGGGGEGEYGKRGLVASVSEHTYEQLAHFLADQCMAAHTHRTPSARWKMCLAVVGGVAADWAGRARSRRAQEGQSSFEQPTGTFTWGSRRKKMGEFECAYMRLWRKEAGTQGSERPSKHGQQTHVQAKEEREEEATTPSSPQDRWWGRGREDPVG